MPNRDFGRCFVARLVISLTVKTRERPRGPDLRFQPKPKYGWAQLKNGRTFNRFADEARFLKAWIEKPLLTGAVSPSGRSLAKMMARYVDPSVPGLVIELGPGTGPVTQALLQRGIAPERLILIEYDPDFCKLLARRFPRLRVIQGDAYDLNKTLEGIVDGPVAAIVSSLPLLTRPDPQRLALLRDAFSFMVPAGRFIQFTYGMLSPIPRKAKGIETLPFLAHASPAVWLNLPPARVFVYQAATEAEVIRVHPAKALMGRLRTQTDKIETRLRQASINAHDKIEARRRLANPHAKPMPALALLRKLGEARRSPKR